MADRTSGRRPSQSTSVLVLGAAGMLGHQLWRECERRFDTTASIRASELRGAAAAVLDPERTLRAVRAEDLPSVEAALDRSGADVVVNCIGLVKQRAEAADPAATVRVNALFPHELAALCAKRGVRLIHVSTDCVFSGNRGAYAEDDPADPIDLYGRSKLLGEPVEPTALTLRTSMIGRELDTSQGLLEWLLAQSGQVRGFTGARFSGPTAPVVARAIAELIESQPDLTGLWHLGAEAISKHDLLVLLCEAFDLDLEVVPEPQPHIDRSLDASRIRTVAGIESPSWAEMVAELAAQREPAQR